MKIKHTSLILKIVILIYLIFIGYIVMKYIVPNIHYSNVLISNSVKPINELVVFDKEDYIKIEDISSTSDKVDASGPENSNSNINVIPEIEEIPIKNEDTNENIINTTEVFYPLTDEERHYIECLVAGEARGEGLEGQKAVAQCIYNATVRSNISVMEVKTEYGYTGWFDNPEKYPTVAQAVSEIFDDGNFITDEFIVWFYNPAYGYSSFHESQKFVIEIGGHRFFAPWD